MLMPALGFLLAGAAILLAAFLTGRDARANLERRESLVAGRTRNGFGLADRGRRSLDIRLRALFAAGARRNWAMRLGPIPLVAAGAAAAGTGWILAFAVLHMPVLASAAAALAAGFLVPRAMLLRQQKRSERAFTEIFPDTLDALTRMVRAGLPTAAAVQAVAHEAPAPVGPVFLSIADQMRIGVPVEDALDAGSALVGLPDFRFFSVAVSLQHEAGGNLPSTLESLADLMRRKRAARRKAKAATGEIRVTAYALAALPFLMIGAMLAVQPDFILPLFADARGRFVLAAAAACILAGFAIMRAMMLGVTKE